MYATNLRPGPQRTDSDRARPPGAGARPGASACPADPAAQHGHLAHRHRSADHRAGSRRLARLARLHRRLPRVQSLSTWSPGPANATVDEALQHQRRARRADHPGHFGRDLARGADRRTSRCWSTPPTPTPPSSCRVMPGEIVARYNGASRRSARARHPGHAADPPLVQPRSRFARNSTARASSCSASPCFRRCSPRSPWRRKASRKPFSRSTSRASPAHEFLLGKILAFMVIALWRSLRSL